MRFYNYVHEATEQKDKEVRKEAQKIFKQMYDWVKKNEDKLDDILHDDVMDGNEVEILDFKDIQDEYDLLFAFGSSRVRDFTFLGDKEEPQIFIPIMGDSLEDIPKNLWKHRRDVMHEIIHFLDYQRTGSIKSKEYYNSPAEFNAYYQETVEDIKEDFEKGRLKINNFEDFVKKVKKNYFDKDFINNLNKKYERKLDKRLYQLYSSIFEVS